MMNQKDGDVDDDEFAWSLSEPIVQAPILPFGCISLSIHIYNRLIMYKCDKWITNCVWFTNFYIRSWPFWHVQNCMKNHHHQHECVSSNRLIVKECDAMVRCHQDIVVFILIVVFIILLATTTKLKTITPINEKSTNTILVEVESIIHISCVFQLSSQSFLVTNSLTLFSCVCVCVCVCVCLFRFGTKTKRLREKNIIVVLLTNQPNMNHDRRLTILS